MKLSLAFADVIRGIDPRLEQSLQSLIQQIQQSFGVEHDADGRHQDVTVRSLTQRLTTANNIQVPDEDALVVAESRGSFVHAKSVKISDSQIKTLNSRPITIVRGETGRIHVPLTFTAQAVINTAYSADQALWLLMEGMGSPATNGIIGLGVGLNATGRKVKSRANTNTGDIALTPAQAVNKGLSIQSAADVTNGAATNSMVFTITYHTIVAGI